MVAQECYIMILCKGDVSMKSLIIADIEQSMAGVLNNEQLERLHEVLLNAFFDKNIVFSQALVEQKETVDYLALFIAAKKVEGCSERTLSYYKSTIENMLAEIVVSVKQIDTAIIREYLSNYMSKHKTSKVTLDNIRRIISSFFAWLEEENYIIKSPVRRIHKIRTGKIVKATYSDEELEIMRDNCNNIRDLAIIDILASTGIRVGELVNMDINDIDFTKRECLVLGKGNKERVVYFDARTKIHLQQYLDTREDNNTALFVSLHRPNKRLKISGVEIRLRRLGRELAIERVHPHKFRRTLATRAIDKGMPIEQVQVLLGHSQIDTTLQYAMVNQSNVKQSHRKYIG